MTIDIGRIGIWSAAFEAHSSSRAREAAQELEAMGYPVLWINEATGRDPFVLATLLLSATSTLKLATGIANVYAPRRHDDEPRARRHWPRRSPDASSWVSG